MQQVNSHSPLLSSRRTITPRREERPNTSNLLKSRKFDRNFENQSNVPVFEASLFKSMELNL